MATTLSRPVAGPTPALRRLTAIACLFGAEAVHVSVIDEHITEWLPAGLFFLVIALLEGVLAVGLITTRTRRVERAVIVVSLWTVALWLFSRTVGIPLGPMAGAAEPVGRADLVSSLLELVTAGVLLARPDATGPKRNPARLSRCAVLIVCAVVALTSLGVAPLGSGEQTPDLTPSVPGGAHPSPRT